MDNRFFNGYPYTDFHELNLSWVISELRSFATTLETFVSINALKYADPIDWNITSQYEKNTIVIDAQTGTAYISVAPVPAGVSLSNTDYWTIVFDLSMFIVRAAQNFTSRWEQTTTTTATFSTSAGDWLVWGDVLYRAKVNITAGDSYVVDSNIEHITMEEIIGHIDNLTTADKTNIVAAINELVSTIGGLDNLTTTDKSSVVSAINELVINMGDLASLITPNTDSLVNAINDCYTLGLYNKTHINISELPDTLPATIQDAIDRYTDINFDVDVNVGSAYLRIPSNRNIYSSNGSTITGTSIVFSVVGEVSASYDAALTFTTLNEGTYVGTIENGKEYMIQSDTNCVGPTARSLGYPNYMGGGTANSMKAYPTIYTMLNGDNSNNFNTTVPTYGEFNTGKAFRFDPIVGVKIHDLNIDASDNHNAHQYANMPVFLKYCKDIELKGINIKVGYGTCFELISCHGCVVDDCQAVALDPNFVEHYHNNVFRLCGCYNVTIQNCAGVGSQPYDITYRGTEAAVSAYCVIDNCTSRANFTGITTHPGTWGCTISRLKCSCFGSGTDGAMIRGSLHTVKDCIFNGSKNGFGIGSIAGSLCHYFENNFISDFQYGYYIDESEDNPIVANTGFANVTDNTFYRCQWLARFNIKGTDTTTRAYTLNMDNNTLRGTSSLATNGLIRVTGDLATIRQHITCKCDVFDKTIDPIIRIDGPMNIRYCMIQLNVLYSPRINPALELNDTGTATYTYLSVKKGRITDATVTGTAIPAIEEVVT